MIENIRNRSAFVRALTKCRMRVVVSYKKEGGKCFFEVKTLEQPNTYTAGTIEEKFGTNAVYVSGNQGLRAIDCSKVKK